MRIQSLFLVTIGMTVLSASPSAQQPSASNPQVAYTSATHQDDAGRYTVAITSTSNVRLLCQIQYTGQTMMGAERSGQRSLFLPPVGQDGAPMVRSAQFAGFRSFTPTVSCAAK